MGGRDRAGMIAMLVLTLVGVDPEDVAADYELSATDPEIAAAVQRAGTTTRAELLRALAEIDLAPFEPYREALRVRLLGDDA
jgi:protein tyrosine/serine phosphatase